MSFRVEEKIALTPSDLAACMSALRQNGLDRLHPTRRIQSVYFDTPDLMMFHASEEGVTPRWKVRIRTYPDTSSDWTLERKTSSAEGRFKTTAPLSDADVSRMMTRGFIDREHGRMAPKVTVVYRRDYFTLEGNRITFDQDIRYSRPNRPGEVSERWRVMEIKAAAGASPDYLQSLIETPRRRFSKYCNAVRAFHLA